MTYANVVSTVCLFIVLGGVSYAITIPRNSVGAPQIKANAVGGSELANNAVSAAEIKNGSLSAGDLAQSARQGLAGAQGPPGNPGNPGSPGQPGAPGATNVTQVAGTPASCFNDTLRDLRHGILWRGPKGNGRRRRTGDRRLRDQRFPGGQPADRMDRQREGSAGNGHRGAVERHRHRRGRLRVALVVTPATTG